MPVPKARPGGVSDSITDQSGNQTGLVDDSGTPSFFVHVMDGDLEYWSPLMDVTGDADTVPIFENNGLLYGSFNFRGAMIAGSALSLANLTTSAENPEKVKLTFHSTTRFVKFTGIVERIRIRWRKNAQIVGVALIGRCTDDKPAMT